MAMTDQKKLGQVDTLAKSISLAARAAACRLDAGKPANRTRAMELMREASNKARAISAALDNMVAFVEFENSSPEAK